jgi:hypothetical protein
MKIKKTALSFSIAILAGLVLAMPASADTLSLVLSNPVQIGIPGSTLTFDATASAPNTNNATVFLNGDNFNVTLDGATIDDSDFLSFPFTLDPGDSYTGPLFTVALPPTITPGTYNTGFFSILGGSDSSAQDTIATANFEIGSPSAVPEPGTWLLLATGVTLFTATRNATLSADTTRRSRYAHPGHRNVGQPIWSLWLSSDYVAAPAGGLEASKDRVERIWRLRVLLLKLLQPPRLVHLHPPVLLAPKVIGLLDDLSFLVRLR